METTYIIEKRDHSQGRWRQVFKSSDASEARFELWNLSQAVADTKDAQPLLRVREIA